MGLSSWAKGWLENDLDLLLDANESLNPETALSNSVQVVHTNVFALVTFSFALG